MRLLRSRKLINLIQVYVYNCGINVCHCVYVIVSDNYSLVIIVHNYLVSPPSQNQDDKSNMAAKTNAQPVVYAELSIMRQQASVKNNKPHPSPIRDNTRVMYSDLLLKGQPPPPPY